MKRNRVGIALSAVGIHASIGSVYAWSVLTKPVMAEMGISLSSTTWARFPSPFCFSGCLRRSSASSLNASALVLRASFPCSFSVPV